MSANISYARRILNQTDESVKAENQKVHRLVILRDQIAALQVEANELCKDISREELKILANEDRWEAIGKLFGFTPQYFDFQGRKVFNWQSCNAAFWKVFRPPQIGQLSESRIYLKALGENEASRKPKRKPKPIPKGTKPNPPRPRLRFPPNAKTESALRALSGMPSRRSEIKARWGKRRIYDPEDLEFINRLVWLKTRGRCFYCKCGLTAKLFISNMVKDHYIPLISGGPDDHSNLVPSCRSCDRMKGGKLPIGLPAEIRRKYVRHHREEHDWPRGPVTA